MKEWPTYVQAVTETRRKRKPKLPVCFQLFLFLNSPDFRACPWKHHSDWSQGCSPRDGDVISYTERGKKKNISQHVAQNIHRDILNEFHFFCFIHVSTFVLLQISHAMANIYRGPCHSVYLCDTCVSPLKVARLSNYFCSSVYE